MRWIALSVAVAGAVAVVVAAAIAGGASSPACGGEVRRGVLPEWARTGFSDPRPRMPHVLGRNGELIAILFGDPLTAPPGEDRSNKILWVAKRTPPPGPLRLSALRDGTGEPVERVVETGPGPSGVDLPAGCWRITARWPGGEDELDLTYAQR